MANAQVVPVNQRNSKLLAGSRRKPWSPKPRENFFCPPGLSTNEVTLRLAEPAQAWDEFHPVRYRMRAVAGPAQHGTRDEATIKFGFRHVERVGQGNAT